MENVTTGEYASYPEGYQKLLEDLNYPTDNPIFKKFYLDMMVAYLLRN